MSFLSGVLTRFGISIINPVIKGRPITVTVTALDAFNITVIDYVGRISFSSTDANAILPPDYTYTTGVNGDNGTHSFSMSFGSPGLQTLTIRDIVSSVSTTTPFISIYYPSSMTFTASPNLAFIGQIVTLNIQIETGPSTSGTVVFNNETTNTILGSGIIYTDNTGAGHLNYPIKLHSGNHTIKATYTGGISDNSLNNSNNTIDLSNFNTSTYELITQVVNKYNSQVSLNASQYKNKAVYGRSFGLNVIVTAVAPGSGVPSGTVVFSSRYASSKQLGIVTLDNTGLAKFSFSDLPAGRNIITATYSGDTIFNGSSSLIIQNVSKAHTTINLTKNPNTNRLNESITFTATVIAPGFNVPTGSVIFMFDENVQLVAILDENGIASISYTFIKNGRHRVRANYVGDSNYNPSNAYIMQSIQ